MKAKFVYENINFERGLKDPFRSLDIGYRAKLRGELEELSDVDLENSKDELEELARYWIEEYPFKNEIEKILKKYSEDPYHKEKISFLRDMIIDVAEAGGSISENEFMDWIIKYITGIENAPENLIREISGILYAVQMI
jgi:hypothetical protein